MAFDYIHNHYKHLVLQRLNDMVQARFVDSEQNFLEDVACVALNQLPALCALRHRYAVLHDHQGT